MRAGHVVLSIFTVILIFLLGMLLAPFIGWPRFGAMAYLAPGPTGKPGSATLGS